MDYSLILSQRAENEIEDAMDWYKSKKPGLEARFLTIIKLHLQLIKKNPHSFPVKQYEFRECVADIFPFVILYRVFEGKIIVHSIFNTYQDPSKKTT